MSAIDPYQTPKTAKSKTHAVAHADGSKSYGPCPHCSSMNGKKSSLSQQRPSIIYFLFVGWIYLIYKALTRKTTVICDDCGEYYNV